MARRPQQAWIKQNPFLGIAYGKAFTSPTNQPRPAITEAEPFAPFENPTVSDQSGLKFRSLAVRAAT